MATEEKNIRVKITVEGDTKYLNALARIETAQAKRLETERKLAAQLDRTRKAQEAANVENEKGARANDNAAKAAGKNRLATVQLGQQVQDFAIQVQGGQSVVVALTQQLSQAAIVAVNMGGTLGKIAQFLAGPWGTAVFLAVGVLTALYNIFGKTDDEAKKTDETIRDLNVVLLDSAASADEVAAATAAYVEELKKQRKFTLEEMRIIAAKTQANYQEAQSIYEKAAATAQLVAEEQRRPSAILGDPESAQAYMTGISAGAAAAEARAAKLRQQANDAALTAQGKRVEYAERLAEYETDASVRVKARYDAARKAAAASIKDIDLLGQAYVGLKAAEESELAALEKSNNARSRRSRERKAELTEEQKEAERYRKEIEDLFEQWSAGGPAIASAKDQMQKLLEVRDKLVAAGADQTIIGKLNEELVKLQDIIKGGQSPIDALIAEINAASQSNFDLNERIRLLKELLATNTDPGILRIINEELDKAQNKADPLLKRMHELALEFNNKGGKKAADLIIKRDELEELKRRGESGAIDLNPEALERVNKQIEIYNKEIERANKGTADWDAQIEKLANVSLQAVSTALEDAITGTKSWGDAFKEAAKVITRALVEIAVKWAIIAALQAAFPGSSLIQGLKLAKGGAIERGRVRAFATGGVVAAPTYFPMAGGRSGLMGEAGPEAIMPLKRTAKGELGVSAAPVNVTVINNAPGVSVQTETNDAGDLAIIVEQTKKAIAADVRRGGNSVSRSFESTYGVSRAR